MHKINEIDRRGSSCPLLFAWDGERYRFLADMIGAGVDGHWVGPEERNIPDSTGYMKIEGEHLRPRHGLLRFRCREPTHQVGSLAPAHLLGAHHPPALEDCPTEYSASDP